MEQRKSGAVLSGGKFQQFALLPVQLQGFIVAAYIHYADLDQL